MQTVVTSSCLHDDATGCVDWHIYIYTVDSPLAWHSHMLECGWIKGLGWLFLQLLPLVLPINT